MRIRHCKRYIFRLWLLCLAAVPTLIFGANPGPVLVDFPSYDEPVSRREILLGHQVREALILALKQTGVPVANDALLTAPKAEFDYRLPYALPYNLDPGLNPAARIRIEQGGTSDGAVSVLLWQRPSPPPLDEGEGEGGESEEEQPAAPVSPAPAPKPKFVPFFQVPADSTQVWVPVQAKIAEWLGEELKPFPKPKPSSGPPPPVSPPLDSEAPEPVSNPSPPPPADTWSTFLADDSYLNLGFVDRLAKFNLLVAQLEDPTRAAYALAGLARLTALHGAYEARIDEITSFRYQARALVFLEMLDQTGFQAPNLDRFREDVRFFAKRFTLRTWLPAPEDPLLPEVKVLLRHERSPAETMTTHPGAGSFWELLVTTESLGMINGYDKAIDRALDQQGFFEGLKERREINPRHLEVALITARHTGFTFDAVMSAELYVEYYCELNELVTPTEHELKQLAETEGFDVVAAIQEGAQTWLSEASTYIGWLGTEGAAIAEDDVTGATLPYLKILGLLYWLDEKDLPANAQLAYATSWQLDWYDIRREFVARHADLVFCAQERYDDLGSSQVNAMKRHIDRFGTDRIERADRFLAPVSIDAYSVVSWDWLIEDMRLLLSGGNPCPADGILLHCDQLRQQIESATVSEQERKTLLEALQLCVEDPDFVKRRSFLGWIDESLIQQVRELIDEGDPEAVPHLNIYVLNQIFEGVFAFPDSYLDAPLQTLASRQANRWARQSKMNDIRGNAHQAVAFAERAFPLIDQQDDFGADYVMILARAGRLHEALGRMARLNEVGFAIDNHRRRVLKWLPSCASFQCPPGLELNMSEYLAQQTTNSALDYLGRSDAAFRLGNWAVMKQAAEDFHYAGSSRRNFLLTIATTMLEQPDYPDWETIETMLRADLSDYSGMALESYDHWQAILDKNFGNAAEWKAIKERTRFAEIAKVHHYSRRLWEPLETQEAREILDFLSALTQGFANEGRVWGRGEGWKRKALLDEHRALARWIVAETNQLKNEPSQELLQIAAKIVQISQQTQPFRANLPCEEPVAMNFLVWLLREGCDPAKVAELPMQLCDYDGNVCDGMPIFCHAVFDPKAMAQILKWPKEARPSRTDDPTKFVLDLHGLFEWAYVEDGNIRDQMALECALTLALDENDFHPMRLFFPAYDESKKWIEHNAPSSEHHRAWMTSLNEDNPWEHLRAKRKKSKPEIPGPLSEKQLTQNRKDKQAAESG